ncbi:iron-containing alcohol dehydrogenase family protein [Pseudarthrobacter sp. SSS035]|uniref:iron-containing alcohol dehydrogenase family protein n=1 Tax=Pseudarthrobacter sp. SSS035 TaxID=2931399 RepID=UPI00200BCA46|nr:iron-containing alcohol dehydrogenase [Pseudarthrobacter sp. SSS035]
MTTSDLLAGVPRDFLAPRQVLVGDGAVAGTGSALAGWSVPTGAVGVIADVTVAENGIAETLLQSLETAGYAPQLFALAAGEPTVTAAQQALDFLRAADTVAVVGIGGGSAMDVAKIAALAAAGDKSIRDLLGINPEAAPGLPLVLVPTTTGTGAEVTRISMLADDRGRKVICSHPLLVPLVTVLDPYLVVGLPPAVTAATGMDAMAHAVEAFLSRNRSPLSAQASLLAIRLLREWLPRAVQNGHDMDARRATLYGAHQAGLALNAGVVLGHSLAYTIANRKHLPHGVTCAIALPYCLAYNAGSELSGATELALTITQGRSEDLDDAAAELRQLAEDLGLPTSLAEIGIGAGEAQGMARECVELYPRPSNPRPFTLDALTDLVTAMATGKLPGAEVTQTVGSNDRGRVSA